MRIKNAVVPYLPVLGLLSYGLLILIYYFATGIHSDATIASQGHHFISWSASVALYSCTILAATVISIYGLVRLWRTPTTWRWLLASVILCALLCTLFACLIPGGAASFGGRTNLPIHRAAVITTINSVLVWYAVFLLVIGCARLSYRAYRRPLLALATNINWFHGLLVSASAMLTAAVLHTAFLYNWGAAMHKGVDEGFARTITTASGMLFSGILILAFTPTAVLLGRAYDAAKRRAAIAHGSAFSIEQWMAIRRLHSNPIEILRTSLAVAAPVAVALAQEFLVG